MNLSGKDYFSLSEAAAYACIDVERFEAMAHRHGCCPFPWMGELVFRKADIQLAMEKTHGDKVQTLINVVTPMA